jgi:hypothetical protein
MEQMKIGFKRLRISGGTAPLHYMPSTFALGLYVIFYLRG